MNLYTAGIIDTTTGFSDSSYRLTNYSVPGLQLALVMVLGVWSSSAYSLGVEVFNLDLGLLLSNPTTLSGMLTSLQLVQWVETADSLAIVSGCSSSIVALTNFYIAGIAGTTPGFGDSPHRLSSAFPGMQVALFMAFGVGSIAFCRLVMGMLLHLESGLLPSNQRCCFTPPGSSFIISDLCRNKFDTNFRVVASWSENVCLKLRLFRAEISGLGPISIGYEPLFLGLNCL